MYLLSGIDIDILDIDFEAVHLPDSCDDPLVKITNVHFHVHFSVAARRYVYHGTMERNLAQTRFGNNTKTSSTHKSKHSYRS